MTYKSAAAIDGDYSNFQLVQSRKVCRIVIEFPIERADEVVRLLGWPKPHSTTRCAVALLNNSVPREGKAAGDGAGSNSGSTGTKADYSTVNQSPPSPAALSPRKWHQLTYAQQAGMRCNEVAFWRWLKVPDKPHAEQSVREWCGVTTRADLDRIEGAGEIWAKMDTSYQAWQRAPAMGAGI